MHNTPNRKPGGKYPFFQKRKSNRSIDKFEEENYPNEIISKKKNSTNQLSSLAILLIIFKVSTFRKRDIDGMVSTIFDSLVSTGILKDDNLGEIPSATTTFVRVPKGKEGVDIILIEPWIECCWKK